MVVIDRGICVPRVFLKRLYSRAPCRKLGKGDSRMPYLCLGRLGYGELCFWLGGFDTRSVIHSTHAACTAATSGLHRGN